MGNMTTALGIAKELVKNNRRYTATIGQCPSLTYIYIFIHLTDL